MTRRRPSARRLLEAGSDGGVPGSVIDIAFAVLVAATIVIYVAKSNLYGFRDDDWWLIQRGRTIGDYFQPYNDHLSIVPIAIYRLLLKGFGLRSYLPLRLIGLGSGAAVAVAIYLLVRSRVGPPFALVAGAAVLWYPSLVFVPSGFNHSLALSAIVFCAWLVTSEKPTADLTLALVLGLALCTSGVAVVGAVGLLAYMACSRPPWRRWAAVAVPSAAWVAWWVFVSKRSRTGDAAQTIGDRVSFVAHGIAVSFRNLVGGNHVLAIVLLILFVANLAWRLRGGTRAASHELAWSAALVSWWVLLSFTRIRGGTFAANSPSSVLDGFRYQIVGSMFVLLALVPRVPPRRALRLVDSYWAAAAALLVAGLIVYANHGDVFRNARALEQSHRKIRQSLIVANLGPTVVPDGPDVGLNLGFVQRLPIAEYRKLVAQFGGPPGTHPAHPDAALVEIGRIRPRVARDLAHARYVPLTGTVKVAATSRTFLRAADRSIVVQIRRFGDSWVTVGRIPPRTTAVVSLPGLQARRSWMIRASGPCLIWTTAPA